MMNFHGCHHPFRRRYDNDEPPLPAPSQYSDQSTTTDGLYASVRPSNITTVDSTSFSDYSEDDNSLEEQYTSHSYGKVKCGRRHCLCLTVVFIMCCLQMIVMVVLGSTIIIHRHDNSKASTEETAAILHKPIAMIPSIDVKDGNVGPATLCAPGSNIKNHSGNCSIIQVLQWLVENVGKKDQATMVEMDKARNNIDQLTNMLNSLMGIMSKLVTNSLLQESEMNNVTRKLNSLSRMLNVPGNLVANPSFENGTDSYDKHYGSSFTPTNTMTRTGRWSAKVSCSVFGGVKQQVTFPNGTRRFTASLWSIANGVTLGKSVTYSLYVDLRLRDGTWMWENIASFTPGTSVKWEQRLVTVTSEVDMDYALVYGLCRYRSGEAYFDDLVVTASP